MILLIVISLLLIIAIFFSLKNYSDKEGYMVLKKDNMKLFYHKSLLWEEDYICKYIMKDVKFDLEKFEGKNIPEILKMKSKVYDNCIVVLNSQLSYEEANSLLKTIRPRIIIHLSDELGNLSDWMNFGKYTRLYMYVHNHPHYKYPDNSLRIPLGYVVGFMDEKPKKIKPMSERKYNATFVGQKKKDRQEMIDCFLSMPDTIIREVDNSWTLDSLRISPPELYNLYSNTKIILNGRGNSQIDCFRISEGIVAGCIVVTVGKSDELKRTITYGDSDMPILGFSSWKEAREQCDILLKKPQEMEKIQEKLISWWDRTIENIRKQIRVVLS